MITRYKLIGKLAVPCADLMEWAHWMETANRRVMQTEVGMLWVSTVFIGLDHSFGEGDPLLFETMVFDQHDDLWMDRSRTWDEAEKDHARAVAWAKDQMDRATALLNEKRS